MQNNYVFVLLGFLGSGKSYVSKWLVPHVGAVYLRADALRLAMFGNDRPELYSPENKALVNNANYYAMAQILASGKTPIVFDANNNTKQVRRNIANEAAKHYARAIIVWVQTPLEIAKERTEVRKATEGHQLFEPNLVEKMAKRLEEPGDDESVITIDGQASTEEQKKSFDDQFAELRNKALLSTKAKRKV